MLKAAGRQTEFPNGELPRGVETHELPSVENSAPSASTRDIGSHHSGLNRHGAGLTTPRIAKWPPQRCVPSVSGGYKELRPARQNHQVDCRKNLEVTGCNPKLNIAHEFERIALPEGYFVGVVRTGRPTPLDQSLLYTPQKVLCLNLCALDHSRIRAIFEFDLLERQFDSVLGLEPAHY